MLNRNQDLMETRAKKERGREGGINKMWREDRRPDFSISD